MNGKLPLVTSIITSIDVVTGVFRAEWFLLLFAPAAIFMAIRFISANKPTEKTSTATSRKDDLAAWFWEP